jgi:hypothetical protein
VRRSAGITISAIVVFAGCGLALLLSAILLLGLSMGDQVAVTPEFTRHVGIFMIGFLVALSVWGIASGLALLQLRGWARISMIVFSALLVIICLPGFLMMLVIPLPVPVGAGNPELTQHFMAGVRIGMAIFYALLTVLGGYWLYFFYSHAVKDQFSNLGPPPSSAWIPPPAPLAATGLRAPPKRPVSITIIAYLTIFGACTFPVILALHLPMMFLGFFFTGGKASLIVIGFMSVQLLMGFGLLRLEPWARDLAIYYFNFAIFNSIISVILPGAQARFDQAASSMQSILGTAPTPRQFPIWSSLIFGLPYIAIQLWLVISRKAAFEKKKQIL